MPENQIQIKWQETVPSTVHFEFWPTIPFSSETLVIYDIEIVNDYDFSNIDLHCLNN